jgi:hypothetical protein
VQDMPPVGGFPSIRIQRRLPSTGPTGVAIFAVGGAVMAYGYYQVRAHLANARLARSGTVCGSFHKDVGMQQQLASCAAAWAWGVLATQTGMH